MGTKKHIRNLLLRAQMTNGRIHTFQTKARWTMFLTLAKGVHEPYSNIEKNSMCFDMRLCSFFEQESRKHLLPHNLVIFLMKRQNKTLTPFSIWSLQALVKIGTQIVGDKWRPTCILYAAILVKTFCIQITWPSYADFSISLNLMQPCKTLFINP
jgi:hypothetical protein